MNSLALMAMNMLQNRPDIKNDPVKMEMLNCIASGDDVKGTRIAEQLCSRNGESKESAMTKARRFFGV